MTISDDPEHWVRATGSTPRRASESPGPETSSAEWRPYAAAEARERLRRIHEWFLGVELARGASFLPEDERTAFLDYYENYPKHDDVAAISRYLRALWRLDTGWVARWIAQRPIRPSILDAGSGFGTFSMIYAALGAEVVGVDLRPDRLDAAERRLAYYEQTTGTSLRVRYERVDVIQRRGQPFDMVWVYNALSHIEPVEQFLQQVRTQLRPGGLLVIGDINGGHPVHAKHLATVRTEVVQEYVAPDGTRHAYAVERAFTPRLLHKLMESHGFTVKRHELFYGGLSILPDPLYAMLSPFQRYVGWNGRLALRQLVVSTPRGTAPQTSRP